MPKENPFEFPSGTDKASISYIAGLFAGERYRQIVKEGFTTEHDDKHDKSELAMAAAAYSLPANWENIREQFWPFTDNWKPDTTRTIDGRIGELVKSGALLIAAIQQLNRLKANGVTKFETNHE